MSIALCKNRYYKNLIKARKICFGMSREMVESAWGPAWSKYPGINGEEVWEWGRKFHSKVKFDADGKVNYIYSVTSTGKEGWSRA